MKKKLIYTSEYQTKVSNLRKYLDVQFGTDIRKQKMQELNKQVHALQNYEEMGISVRDVYGIDCDYRCIYVINNYIFYHVMDNEIRIVRMYDEREDFMWKMFGIKTSTEESDKYWGDQ